MSVWMFTLPFPRPPKGLHSNDRVHHMVKASATKQVRELVAWQARALHIPFLTRCGVQVTWVVPDRRTRDEDGPEPLCKAIFDGLGSDRGVSARIVPDDTPEHMHKPRLVIEHRPGVAAHFQVEVSDLSHPFRPAAVDAVAERLKENP